MSKDQNFSTIDDLISEQYSDSTAHSNPFSTDNPPDAKQCVKQLAEDVKRTTKKILHIDYTKEQIGYNEHAAPHEINDNPSFNPSQTLEVEAGTLKQIKNKLPTPHNLKELGHIIGQPTNAGEEEASKALDASETPHLSREDDDNLIDAHDKLKELKSSDPVEFGIEERIANLHRSIDDMEEDRKRKQVAWISSRYVSGARIVPDQQYHFPFLSTCRWVDESGEPQGARWSQWVDQLRSFVLHIWTEKPSPSPNQAASEKSKNGEKPDYDQDVLLQDIERIVISSSPLQRWISDLRKLRDWQNPRRTALWLSAWLAVWTCDRFFTSIYLYSAYRVLQTRTAFDKRESLKVAYDRADADDQMSNTISEMIANHGSTQWLQPTLDTVGSAIQPKLTSVADWLEIFINFPEAKTTRATISIISALMVAILVSLFTSTKFCVRALELALIILFFIDKPLAERYPRYRSVMLPLHWILWAVPTTTESSFRSLRQQAREIRKGGFDDVDLLATKCKWGKVIGSIVLTSHDMRFMRNFPEKELWRRPFEDIVEMRKGDGRTSLLKRAQHFAEFRSKDGSVERLKHLRKNDEVFNIIFAFSELQWQQI